MDKLIKKIAIIAAAITFASCSTTISSKVQRPAQLDLDGAGSISVLPFQEDEDSGVFLNVLSYLATGKTLKQQNSDKKKIANYMTDSLTTKIVEADYYDLISASVVAEKLKKGDEIPTDIYITGHISDYDCDDIKTYYTSTDSKGNKSEKCVFSREVSVTMTFEIIDSETHRVIHKFSDKAYERSEEADYPGLLPTPLELLKSDLDHISYNLIAKIQPYTETVTFTLLKDDDKNKDMKTALKLADKNNIDAAQKLFLELYEADGIWQAGYNAAIIYQAKGDYEKAESLMTQVAEKTRNEKAYAALSSIQSDIKSLERLNEQLGTQ